MDGVRRRILPNAAHTREDRAAAYRAMAWAAEMLGNAVLDAPYGHREDREDIAAIADRIYLIECAVGVETALARLAARGPDPVRLDLTSENTARLVREYRYWGEGLLLDSETLPTAECLARVERYLDSGRMVPARRWAAVS